MPLTFRLRRRAAAGFAAACAVSLLGPHAPARAQFVCTPNGTGQTCTNSGTTNQGVSLIINTDGDGTVINSGTASASGGNLAQNMQVFVNGNGNGSITNSGTASASAGNLAQNMQLFVNGNGNGSLTNSGTASASAGNTAQNMQLFVNGSGSGSITNSGTATAAAGTNGLAQSISLFGTGIVINSGTATASAGPGGRAQAITISGDHSTLVNGGLVAAFGGNSANSWAINLTGNSETLTNIIGSRVIGAINFGGTNETVNFVGGGNWFFTFNTLAGPNFNTLAGTTINAGGAPFVVSGNKVAVLDPTPFALADRSLMNFTGGISQLLQGRFNGMPGGAPAGYGGVGVGGLTSFAATPASVFDEAHAAFAGIPAVAMAYASDSRPAIFKAPAAVPYYDTVVWANGFGGQRRQQQDGLVLKATDTAYGGAVGVDRLFTPNFRFGGFIGGGTSRQKIDFDTQVTDTDYVFGGVYGRYDWVSRLSISRSTPAA